MLPIGDLRHSILVIYAVKVKIDMYLLWLRVAAVLYAAASVAVFPAVIYGLLRWRKACVHLGGMAFFFHFVSAVEMLVEAHRWMPVGLREIESLLGLAVAGLFFLVWWLYDAISLGIFAFPATFFLILIPALGPDRYYFASEGVRKSWLVAHIAALLLSLCGALLQRIGLRALPCSGTPHQEQAQAGPGLLVGAARLAAGP